MKQKTNLTKILAFFLMAMLILPTLAGCGSSSGSNAGTDSPYVGKWISVAGEALGIVITDESVQGFSLDLKPGGKGTIEVNGQTGKLKWKEGDDNTLVITVEGTDFIASIGEDTLVINDLLNMGLTLTFAKEGSDAADPSNYASEEDKFLFGSWQSTAVVDVLGNDASEATAPDGLSMTFESDHTVSITRNGTAMDKQTWSNLGDFGSLDSFNSGTDSISWNITDSKLTVDWSVDGDYFTYTMEKLQ